MKTKAKKLDKSLILLLALAFLVLTGMAGLFYVHNKPQNIGSDKCETRTGDGLLGAKGESYEVCP